jgi:tRNA threonylcarbamoyladenosine biosynthesis protein TsaB
MAAPAEPRLLILETSGQVGQVALAQGETLVCGRLLDQTRRHARDLVPAVAELLAAQGWQPRDVQAVIVSRGPGSYTGLRVGIMSAKAFAYATGCAVLAIDTFAAVAFQAPGEAVRLEVIADAQQDKVYVQRFAWNASDQGWRAESPLAILRVDDWIAGREGDAWVTGPGLHVYRTRLLSGTPVTEAQRWDPRLESLLRLGLARCRKGERDDFWTLEPLYLRPSSAEEKWQARPNP